MSHLEILALEEDFFGNLDDAGTFERIHRSRDGRMPVGRGAAAARSSRREDRWRHMGRRSSWHREV
jgi:hypothetical protein